VQTHAFVMPGLCRLRGFQRGEGLGTTFVVLQNVDGRDIQREDALRAAARP